MAVLKELLAKVEYECIRGSMEQEVTDIVYDSRKVEKGCMFVCIPGAKADGHDYAKGAVEAGAYVLLVEKEVEIPAEVEVTVIKVSDSHYAMAFVSDAFLCYQADHLKIIVITLTN